MGVFSWLRRKPSMRPDKSTAQGTSQIVLVVIFLDEGVHFTDEELSKLPPVLLKSHSLDIETLQASGTGIRVVKIKNFRNSLTSDQILPEAFITQFSETNMAVRGLLSVQQIPIASIQSPPFDGAVMAIWRGEPSSTWTPKRKVIWYGNEAVTVRRELEPLFEAADENIVVESIKEMASSTPSGGVSDFQFRYVTSTLKRLSRELLDTSIMRIRQSVTSSIAIDAAVSFDTKTGRHIVIWLAHLDGTTADESRHAAGDIKEAIDRELQQEPPRDNTGPDFSGDRPYGYDIESILRSFEEVPDAVVRVISLRGSSAVLHFRDALVELQKAKRIPANVEIRPVIGFSAAAWEEGKADVHEAVLRGRSLLVPATDKDELSRELANRHGMRRVLRFECSQWTHPSHN